MGNNPSPGQPNKAEGQHPVPSNPAVNKLKFHNICGHNIKLLEGQTKAVWQQNKKGSVENVAFTNQPIKLGDKLQISFLKKGYINIGVLHSDPNNVNVVEHAPMFTETVSKGFVQKLLYLTQDKDQMKIYYGNIDEQQEQNLELNAEDSAEVWVYFEIVHGDVEIELNLLSEHKDLPFHARHGKQIELYKDGYTAYLKEGFLSVASIVEYPVTSLETFQICAHFLHDRHGFVYFRFGILTLPPEEIKNFSDLSKELRSEKLDGKPGKIWVREAWIKKEKYKGQFYLRWSQTEGLKHNITEDCSEETIVPQTDNTNQAWLLFELFQMEATVHIGEAVQPLPDTPKRQTNSRYVLITKLEDTVDKETLRMRLEVALDHRNPVQKIVYGSSSDKVVVIFSEPVSPKFLENLLRKNHHDYIFKEIKEPTVVQVLDIPQGGKYLNAVKLYLTNETNSGGSKAADFYGNPNPEDGFCLIDVKSPEVVKRVCEREHSQVGVKGIRILPYYDHLGLAVNFEDRPNDPRSEKFVLKGIDEEMLKFIHDKMKIELQDFMNSHRIGLVDQSLNSLTFSPCLMDNSSASDEAAAVIGTEWKTRVEKAFREKFLQLYVEKLEIKDERKWIHLQDKREELCRSTTAVTLYEDTCHRTFILVSRKSDEKSLKSLKGKIESEEPPEEFVNDIVDGFSSMKFRAFEVLGFKNDVESKTKVELNIHVNDGKIELTGPKKNNQEAKIEIVKKLGSLQETTCLPPNEDYIEILKSHQLIEQCNREIEKKKLRGTWGTASDGDNKKVVVCYEFSEKDSFNQIKNLILGLLETDVIAIDGDIEHKFLDDLSIKIRDIENSLEPFAKVKILEDSPKKVRITCRKDLMAKCRQEVKDFIDLHHICTCDVSVKAAIADYMHDKMKSQIEEVFLDACGIIPVWTFKGSKFYVTGNQIVRSKCTKVLYTLASKVIVTWRPIVRKGIQTYFTSGAGKNMESQVPNCHLKILRQDEFQKQNIRAIALTDKGQALCMGVMDLYRQPVDGVVNVMDEDFEHFKRGGIVVEREIADYIKANGKLTEGQVFITGPGTLPCFKILHAVAPKWRGGTESEEKTLKNTIENILMTADSKSVRSIAMPLVACASLFGYPIKRACGILLQTIIKLCHTRIKSIREIYICDLNSNKIEQLRRLAEGMFASQCFSIPLGQNLALGKTIGPNPNKDNQEELQILVQRRGIRIIPLPAGRRVIVAWGDLARLSSCTPPLKADIIVNPSTTFPVLTGDIANGLKAAASNGGTFDLDSECRKSEPQGGLQKGSYVATDTPHMSCDQILHLRIEGDWNNINDETLKTYIKSCMNYALSKGKRSIAFPTIGTGKIGYPRDAVARCFVHAIAEFSQAQTSGSLEEVIIVIYHRDSETTMAFEQELQNLLAKRPHRLVANIEEEIMDDEDDEKEETRSGSSSSANPSAIPSHSSPIQLGTYQLRNGGNLTLMYGSLEVSGAEALVSPTSSIPNLNGVIPSAIKKAAGGTTIEDELQRKYGKGVKVGDIAITGAENIRGCNKVYHLKLEDYNSQKGSQAFLIYNSVNMCLSQADTDAVSSIAFPTIGTGGFKWPTQLVADETFQAVESYFNSRTTSRTSLHVNIVIFSQNSPEDLVFQTTAKNKLGQGGSSRINSGPMASVDFDQGAIATCSNVKIELLPGKLEEAKADVIVSTTSSFPNLNGVIARTLSKIAGPSLQTDCDKNYPNGIKDGEVASTSGGNLNCTKVFHIKLPEWNHANGKSVVDGAVTECLKMLQSAGLHSIAFATIGTGGFKYPAKDVASAMFESAKQFSQSNPGYHFHITIVLFPPAKDVNQAFKDILCQTFQDVKEDVTGKKKKKKGVRFADNGDDDETVFTEKETSIDHENRDFVLLKFISDSTDSTNKAFQSIRKKIDGDFLGYDPLKHEMIGHLRQSDIQEIEIICRKLDVEVEVSKKNKEISFEGTAGNVRKANVQVLDVIKALNEFVQQENVGKLVKPYFEWCYEEMKNILIPYPRKIGIELEIAFTNGDKKYEFTDIDDLKYCVDFSKYVEFEVSKKSNKVKVVRLDRMTGDLEPLPANWDQKDTNNLKVVTLQTTDKEYLDVEANFKSTLGTYQLKKIHEKSPTNERVRKSKPNSSNPEIDVTLRQIKSIRNRTIYQQYALKRRLMQHQNPNLQSVEMTLWHGTAPDIVDKINLNGFNRSYAGQTFGGKVWYGKGVYFSTQSVYGCADHYTKRDAKLHKYMYQCKVLTGNSTVVVQGYNERYPPIDSTTGMKFDSTSSPNKDEYVIYSDTQAYPEYLIEFE